MQIRLQRREDSAKAFGTIGTRGYNAEFLKKPWVMLKTKL